MQVGTRYSHYLELREAFAEGVQIMKNALEYHSSDADKLRLQNLQIAVNYIDKRIEFLSEYDKHASQFSAFARDLNSIPPAPPPNRRLPEVSSEVQRACEQEMRDAEIRRWRTEHATKKTSTENYQSGAPADKNQPTDEADLV
jgi:hypothetical protein